MHSCLTMTVSVQQKGTSHEQGLNIKIAFSLAVDQGKRALARQLEPFLTGKALGTMCANEGKSFGHTSTHTSTIVHRHLRHPSGHCHEKR